MPSPGLSTACPGSESFPAFVGRAGIPGGSLGGLPSRVRDVERPGDGRAPRRTLAGAELLSYQAPDLDALLKKAKAGDQPALMEVLEHAGPQIRARLAAKISGPWKAAIDEDDVMQVTYIEAVMRLDHFTSGQFKEFTAWLSRLAENNLIDAIRAMECAKRPNPSKKLSVAPGVDSMTTLVELLGVTYNTPSMNAARGEAAGILEDAIKALPPDYETVIRMYDIQGKNVQEVATELKRSEGAVFMLRARAHDRLRELLGSGSKFFSRSS